jgi:hypothetical protein
MIERARFWAKDSASTKVYDLPTSRYAGTMDVRYGQTINIWVDQDMFGTDPIGPAEVKCEKRERSPECLSPPSLFGSTKKKNNRSGDLLGLVDPTSQVLGSH